MEALDIFSIDGKETEFLSTTAAHEELNHWDLWKEGGRQLLADQKEILALFLQAVDLIREQQEGAQH